VQVGQPRSECRRHRRMHCRMRKVRTPQSRVPREERGLSSPKRRETESVTENKPPRANPLIAEEPGERVKRRGKSSPPRQQCRGHDKPHLEQDQIWEKKLLTSVFASRRMKLSGRSLELRSNPWPREMAASSVVRRKRQNSAYRPALHSAAWLPMPPGAAHWRESTLEHYSEGAPVDSC
jgi:hypothetical protein